MLAIFNYLHTIFFVDFIASLPRVFDAEGGTKISLQNALNELMKTGSRDAYVTRLWSTCSSVLTIKKPKEQDKEHFFIVDDSHLFIVDDSHLPLPDVLKCVQLSSQQMMTVSVAVEAEKNHCFGELYAYFLIMGHTHTTHYVNMSEEFPINTHVKTRIAELSSRCNKSVDNTKILVLVEVASINKEKEAAHCPREQPSTSTRALQAETQIDTPEVSQPEISHPDILKALLVKLLTDGNKIVVLLTYADEKMVFSPLFKEVQSQIDKQVSIFIS
jgi:hypothetical protein